MTKLPSWFNPDQKPRKPSPPKKMCTKKTTLGTWWDWKLPVDQIPASTDYIRLDGDLDSANFEFCADIEQPNPNYEKEMVRYEKKLKQYEDRLAKWEECLAIREANLKDERRRRYEELKREYENGEKS